MKKILLIISIPLFIGLVYGVIQYLALGSDLIIGSTTEVPGQSETVPYEIVEVARGLDVPWSIVFTSPTRILITERSGAIRVIQDGVLVEKPIMTFPEVSSTDEE